MKEFEFMSLSMCQLVVAEIVIQTRIRYILDW